MRFTVTVKMTHETAAVLKREVNKTSFIYVAKSLHPVCLRLFHISLQSERRLSVNTKKTPLHGRRFETGK